MVTVDLIDTAEIRETAHLSCQDRVATVGKDTIVTVRSISNKTIAYSAQNFTKILSISGRSIFSLI